MKWSWKSLESSRRLLLECDFKTFLIASGGLFYPGKKKLAIFRVPGNWFVLFFNILIDA